MCANSPLSTAHIYCFQGDGFSFTAAVETLMWLLATWGCPWERFGVCVLAISESTDTDRDGF